MDHLRDIIQHCHQRHKKPFRQRKTKVTPALHKAMPYHFTVYCAHRYPVKLHDLEQANISFMPIGLAPVHESGPKDFGGERFLRRQSIEDWEIRLWHQSFGIQMYTGVPSEQDGAQWHDIDFTYQAICVAPEAVYTCIETLVNTVANPLLTISKSGGLRFSCRVQNYLHPNTEDSKQYIYKDTWSTENSRQRDVYLEISGDKRYNQWDARHEILLGNLLEPPVISKEVLFAPIDALRAALHESAPFDKKSPEPIAQTTSVAPPSLGSYNLDLAKEAFLHRGFSYFRQDGDIHLWHKYTGKVSDEHVSLWENEGTVWVRASAPNIGLPIEATPIVAVWDNTGILSPLSTAGLPVSEQVLAVREGKLSPLAIKRPPAALHKQENVEKVYDDTLEKNATQAQRVFNETERILGLIADRGSGKSYGAETYVLNGGAINLNGKPWEVEGVEQGFKQNVSSIIHMRSRMFRWQHAKDIPAEARMAAPFQHGNLCEDPERCDALERKGGNPLESICPECPVYTACQDRGYLSQFDALQHAKVQISEIPQLFFNPQQKEIVEEMLKQVDETERLCIADEVETHELFLDCNISKGVLEEWWVNWQGNTLGNFARALLNALETKGDSDDNPVRRIRASMQAFEGQTEELISQMCQANVRGRVTERGMVDDETGNELARFTIEFEGGTSAYIPLDSEAADRLRAKGLPFFHWTPLSLIQT